MQWLSLDFARFILALTLAGSLEVSMALAEPVQPLPLSAAASTQMPLTGTPTVATPAVAPVEIPKAPAPSTGTTVTLNSLAVKFDGVTFLKYRYEWLNNTSSEPRGYNSFDLDRAYLNFEFTPREKMKLRYTLEGGDKRELTAASGSSSYSTNNQLQYEVVTKFLYVELSDVFYTGDRIRWGLQGSPWTTYEEKIWGYRFNNKVAVDKYALMPTTDLGVSYGGGLPNGRGEWAFMISNGEGWTSRETGRDKDYTLFAQVYPWMSHKELTVAAAGIKGTDDPSTQRSATDGSTRITQDHRDRWMTLVAWKQPKRLTLGASYTVAYQSSTRDDRNEPRAYVVSLYTTVNSSLLLSTDKWEAVVRYDGYDPDREGISGNDYRFLEAGVSYAWNEKMTTLVSCEGTTYSGEVTSAAHYNEKRFLVQTKVDF